MNRIPVGSRVKVNPLSEYAYQSGGGLGKVIRNNRGMSTGFYYDVLWDNGKDNCYRDEDLILEDKFQGNI